MAIEKNVLSENDRIAARLRNALGASGTLAVNLISSPGSGKTMLLEKTLEMLPAGTRAAVLTGDIQTDNDARRLAAMATPFVRSPPPAHAIWTRAWWRITWPIGSVYPWISC